MRNSSDYYGGGGGGHHRPDIVLDHNPKGGSSSRRQQNANAPTAGGNFTDHRNKIVNNSAAIEESKGPQANSKGHPNGEKS